MSWIENGIKKAAGWIWEQFMAIGTGAVDMIIDLIPDEIAMNFEWLGPYWAHLRFWIPVDAIASMVIIFYGALFVIIAVRLILRAIPTVF